MKRYTLPALALIAVTAGAQTESGPRVYAPSEAIELAKSMPSGKSVRFEMVVVATGKTPRGTFLNSTADYRAPDNLTFRLTPVVAKALSKFYGAPAEIYFKGKRIVVDGRVREELIANVAYGEVRSVNRYQHQVDVDRVSQLVSLE